MKNKVEMGENKAAVTVHFTGEIDAEGRLRIPFKQQRKLGVKRGEKGDVEAWICRDDDTTPPDTKDHEGGEVA